MPCQSLWPSWTCAVWVTALLHQPVHQYPRGHWSPLRYLCGDGLHKWDKAAKASPQFSKPHEWFSTGWKVTGVPVFWRTLLLYTAQWIYTTDNSFLRERIILCLVACWGRSFVLPSQQELEESFHFERSNRTGPRECYLTACGGQVKFCPSRAYAGYHRAKQFVCNWWASVKCCVAQTHNLSKKFIYAGRMVNNFFFFSLT